MTEKAGCDWNNEQASRALAQGWIVSETHGAEEPYQLQRSDELEIFDDDGEAWKFVAASASAGDVLSQTALNFLQSASPIEYANIMRFSEASGEVLQAVVTVSQLNSET